MAALATVRTHGVDARDPAGRGRVEDVPEGHTGAPRGAVAAAAVRRGTGRSRLGADPLRPDADPDEAWARVSRSRAPSPRS
jgi:endonuclease-8